MSSTKNLGDVFTGGATTSQHVEAEDDDHFENTTFKLKRTRSLGLLDEFIQPLEGDKPKHESEGSEEGSASSSTSQTSPPEASSNKQELDDSKDHAIEEDEQDRDNHKFQGSVALKSPEMLPHDDTDIHYEPSRHVDYLSHQWDVSDISKSWRYVIQKRKDVANSARLENASWRTWAQRRSNLKTISPEVVNWSKDSDVTWLYGPILNDDDGEADDEENHKRITTATSAVAGDISIPSKPKKGPKPILKRRTVQDMMISHSNLLKLQLATNRMHDKQRQQRESQDRNEKQLHNENEPPEFDDYEAISAKLNSQYKNIDSLNNSMVNLHKLNENEKQNSTTEGESDDISITTDKSNNNALENTSTTGQNNNSISTITNSSSTSTSTPVSKEDRHIHFNEVVQQCIAVDEYSDEDDEDYYEYDDDDYYYEDEEEDYLYETPHEEGNDSEDDENDDDDDEGGFFLKVKSPSSPNVPMPGLSLPGNKENNKANSNNNTEDTDSISTTNSKVHRSIHLLPSTTLNYGSSDEESDEENPYTSSLSHNANNRGYDYYYDYNTVYTCDPNHAIYGLNNKNDSKVPDVVDVPENITLGSNFDYEVIENNDFNNDKLPIIDPSVINGNNVNYSYPNSLDSPTSNVNEFNRENQYNNNILSDRPYHTSGTQGQNVTPFNLGDSDSEEDSEEDSDDGLSINTRRSSQSLAQLVFAQSMTSPTNNDENSLYPTLESEPAEGLVSKINPRHSSTSISKQSTSSNSLSQLFFSGGLTKEKLDENKALALSFFNTEQSEDPQEQTDNNLSMESSQLQRTLSNTQRKASPLPPHTTSANAFLGSATPPLERQPKKAFSFDSESESEDEYTEEVVPRNVDNTTPSYASLSQVADKNGIRSPSPDVTNINSPQSISSNTSSLGSQNKNIVGQAKGLANHFLGNWKGNE